MERNFAAAPPAPLGALQHYLQGVLPLGALDGVLAAPVPEQAEAPRAPRAARASRTPQGVSQAIRSGHRASVRASSQGPQQGRQTLNEKHPVKPLPRLP